MRAYLRLKNPILKELEGTLPHRGNGPENGNGVKWADHVGIDEAGRGCLAGPVVATAIIFPADMEFGAKLPGLTDSKKLSERQRDQLVSPICDAAVAWGTGVAWQNEIDSVNILCATHRAMSRAVLALYAKLEESHGPNRRLPELWIDGNRPIPETHWDHCCRGIPAESLAWEQYLPAQVTRMPAHPPALPSQQTIVGGDSLVPAISAASILAKTKRDTIMRHLNSFFPDYGFAQHKGYGTKEHRDILTQKGPCPLHRTSFKLSWPQDEKRGCQASLLEDISE